MKQRLGPAALVVALVAVAPSRARGEERPEPEAAADVAAWRRAVAVVVALGPGAFVHGAGTFTAGERDAAYRLAAAEGIGLAGIFAAALPIGLTGASRRLSRPFIPIGVAGAGLFLTSWAADVYGAAGVERLGGAPREDVPRADLELGYAYVRDPQFDYASFLVGAADVWIGRVRISPELWIAADDDNQLGRAEGAVRLRGARRGRLATSGSFLDVVAAAGHHRYGDEMFSVTSVEAGALGRYDLAGLAPALAGSFAELGGRFGVEHIRFRGAGEADVNDLFAGGFAFGIYLGQGRGELRLGYDHRRDGLEGGLALPASGNGFLGRIVVDGFVRVNDRLAIAADFTAGSAYISHLGLRWEVP